MQRALTLRLSGRAVSDGKVAVTDLARIVERLEQAIGHLTRGGTEGVARKPRFVLTRIGQGSCVTELELDGPASDALEGFHVEPLEQLVSGASEPDGLLPGDAAETIAALRMDLPRGIDWIELSCASLTATARIERRHATGAARSLKEHRAFAGRLMEVDFNSSKATLHVQPMTKRSMGGSMSNKHDVVPLTFLDDLADDMQRCARQYVMVNGDASLSVGGAVRSVAISSIWTVRDDRHVLWGPKRFSWPKPDELIVDPNIEEFIREIYEARRDSS